MRAEEMSNVFLVRRFIAVYTKTPEKIILFKHTPERITRNEGFAADYP